MLNTGKFKQRSDKNETMTFKDHKSIEQELAELKADMTDNYGISPELDYMNDQVNLKLIEIMRYRKQRNRLAILNEMPELLILFKRREILKPYGRKMRLKIKALKGLYNRRSDKAFMDKIDKKIEARIKKELAKQKKDKQ